MNYIGEIITPGSRLVDFGEPRPYGVSWTGRVGARAYARRAHNVCKITA